MKWLAWIKRNELFGGAFVSDSGRHRAGDSESTIRSTHADPCGSWVQGMNKLIQMDNGKCFTLIIFLHTQFLGTGTLYIITFAHYPMWHLLGCSSESAAPGRRERIDSHTYTCHRLAADVDARSSILIRYEEPLLFHLKKYYEESAAAGHSIYNIIKIQVEMSWCLSMRVGNSHEN
jgi:hypothetical protein